MNDLDINIKIRKERDKEFADKFEETSLIIKKNGKESKVRFFQCSSQ